MKRPVVLIYLLGVAMCASLARGSQQWPGAPEFCHHKDCPEYSVIAQNQDFEERVYKASRWLTTQVPSSGTTDLTAGFYRLQGYCGGANEKGRAVSQDSWPGLLTITEGVDGAEHGASISWFMPPNQEAPAPTDTSVKVIKRPAETIYVRVFSGSVSQNAGHVNTEQLRQDLTKAGKAFDRLSYTGAAYEGRFYIFTRHNEVWIKAT